MPSKQRNYKPAKRGDAKSRENKMKSVHAGHPGHMVPLKPAAKSAKKSAGHHS